MKKLLYTFFVAAAGLMLASCKQEHIEVVYNPDATTVQTLGNFSETVLTEGGANLVATFTPADFKIDAAKSYALYTSSAADMSDKSKMLMLSSTTKSACSRLIISFSPIASLLKLLPKSLL